MAPTGRAGRCGVESLEPSLNPVDALELGDLVSIHFMFKIRLLGFTRYTILFLISETDRSKTI